MGCKYFEIIVFPKVSIKAYMWRFSECIENFAKLHGIMKPLETLKQLFQFPLTTLVAHCGTKIFVNNDLVS